MAENQEATQCLVLSDNRFLIEEVSKCGLSVSVLPVSTLRTPAEFLAHDWSRRTEMIVIDGTGSTAEALVMQVSKMHDANQQTFICVFGEDVGRDGRTRIAVADVGAAMTSWSTAAVREAGRRVLSTLQHTQGAKTFSCPYCQKSGLSEDGLWLHCPMYHLNKANIVTSCPICESVPREYIQVSLLQVVNGIFGQANDRLPGLTLLATQRIYCPRITTQMTFDSIWC